MSGLVFERTGKGFPLVLIHGYLAGAKIWQDQISYFKHRFEVFAVNLPGFADSALLEAPNTILGFAKTILSELTALGIEKFHLMGHSMGGMIVQKMAAIEPDRVDHLICYATGPAGVMPDRFESIDQSRTRLEKDGLEQTVKRIAATWFIKQENAQGYELCVEMGKRATLQASLASLSAWESWDGKSDLKKITAKTLIVWGDKDRSYGWSQPEALWHGIKNSNLAVVPGCAHNVHMEKPDIFNAIVMDFLPAKLS